MQLVDEAITDLRERLTTAFEARLLLSTVRQNDIVEKLASWGAIFAVPAAIAGIYGMNFKKMPLQWSFGYPAALLRMPTSCVILYCLFRTTDRLQTAPARCPTKVNYLIAAGLTVAL